jgi:DNA-binding beta-propeller fold protein YncE
VSSITLHASYTNYESSHVSPIALTPSGDRLLAVNTPDALLEVFTVQPDGSLDPASAIRVGLEPVTVRALDDHTAWVVNNLSDTISIVDLDQEITAGILVVGNEPTDVVFAQGKAFVAVSEEDVVKVYDLTDLSLAPSVVPLFGRDIRALAVSNDGSEIYAVVLRSGNRTTVVNGNVILANTANLDAARLSALGLRDVACSSPPPPYPPLPPGITRNPALPDPLPNPPNGNQPAVGLIVKWDDADARWEDETGASWNDCLPYRLADNDLFVIDAATFAVTTVRTLGTSLFGVSVQPGSGKIWVPNTEARNSVRFEHPLGVQGHMVDNRLSVVDPSNGNAVTVIDLNTHINRASDPSTNLTERVASISQPGTMAWKGDGSVGYLSAIGSRKIFRVDGGCLSGSCIFGPSRVTPNAVEVGEGPTGVALHEGHERLYVLNRISHSVAIVDTSSFTKLEEIPLHDPSSTTTRDGRRLLYDAIDTSGHGDAACASCHLFGDLDGLAWDLGDPTGAMALYSTTFDNVRFIDVNGNPCDPGGGTCTQRTGFDPQKGPMTTQTLRGMLEPLHWRGDRATMNDFNPAFVGLMGREDIGPINGKPAGLTAEQMELFRQFALAVRTPPNPHRAVDDTLPCGPRATDPGCETQPHGALFPGNPTEGELLFNTAATDAGNPCVTCHQHPFGAAGGKLGGVTPQEPTSQDAAALFIGVLDQSIHSDLKIGHLRNMYEKFGPVLAAPGDPSMPETVTGFGYTHDGAGPDLYRFLSINVFTLSAANQAREVRDIATFLFYFPTETRPAVGGQVTLPAGTPPTGSTDDEALLATLIGLGDLGDENRHCELTATTLAAGRSRAWHLSGGSWVTDAATEPPVTTTALRESAVAPITFTCATIDSGQRLGGNRDEDAVLDGDDCAPGDADTWVETGVVTGVALEANSPTTLTWDEQATISGPSVRYDLVSGSISDLRSTGLVAASSCLEGDLDTAEAQDARPDPPAGDGYFYLLRAENPCFDGTFGTGRETLDGLTCSAP